MTTQAPEKRRQSHEKGVHYPYMDLLDKLIEESKKEMFEEKASLPTTQT